MQRSLHRRGCRSGLTLVELLAVVTIVAVVAAIAAGSVSFLAARARLTAAEADLAAIRDSFVSDDAGYLADMQGIPGFSTGFLRIANLLVATNLYGRAEGAATGERVDAPGRRPKGCAESAEFTRWSEARSRGWRGPYLRSAAFGEFPGGGTRKGAGEPTFAERGFFPDVGGLLVPADFKAARLGCSVYGFPGEPCVIDPWGNPYVLQIPPPQAFEEAPTNVTDSLRWRYARVVSAGPDGVLSTPCFEPAAGYRGEIRQDGQSSAWGERMRRLSRQAGLIDGSDRSARGDDAVLFINRNDNDEGEGAGVRE